MPQSAQLITSNRVRLGLRWDLGTRGSGARGGPSGRFHLVLVRVGHKGTRGRWDLYRSKDFKHIISAGLFFRVGIC